MSKHIFGEILTWSAELPAWQNEAIRRMFQRGTLTPKDKDELFEIASAFYGLKPETEKADLMLKSGDLPAPVPAGQKIKLNSISKLINVNALKPDQQLSIGTQLTVVYGENASGKSGYARVMKKAFRARAVEAILPNVYNGAAAGPAKASFEVEEAGAKRPEEWTDGSPSAECFGRFAVFDSKCARVYISENNQLEFVPYGLDIIEALAGLAAEFKKRLQETAKASTPKMETLRPLIDATMVGKFIGGLSVTTSEEDVKKLGVWSPADAQIVGEKDAELIRLKANSPQTIRAALASEKKSLEAIVSAITLVSDGISTTKVEGIKSKAEAFVRLDQAVAASAKLAFGDAELPGIGGEVWREFLISAANFSTKQAYPGKTFPVLEDGAHCVLCLQPLDAPAKARLKRFWEFLQDDVSARRNAVQTELNTLLVSFRKIPKVLPREVGLLADGLATLRPKLSEQLKAYYAAAGHRMAGVEAAVFSGSWVTIPGEPASLLEDCKAAIDEIDQQAGKFKDDAGASQAITALQVQIDELKARKRLNENLALVLGYLKALKSSAAASAAATKISTKAISDKASDLDKKYVTGGFRTQIEAELKPLALARVRAGVDKKTDKGKVVHKVTVDGASVGSPDSVFSEGERTAVSLAWFLAELAASEDNCGIILDDPLSSLDHRIREAMVTRLVAEAKKRQVIIFTHDLVFYRELLGEADRQGVLLKFQNVEALGDWTGIITGTAPWDAMKVKNRITILEQTLKAAKDAETSADPVKYKSAFRDFYGYLRSTWERAVEELLFHRVIERLEPEVKTMSLTGVDVDAPAVEAVFKGMTRASGMISAHDHAAAKNTALPASGDMDNDLAELKKFVERQKTKIKESEEKLAHLKK